MPSTRRKTRIVTPQTPQTQVTSDEDSSPMVTSAQIRTPSEDEDEEDVQFIAVEDEEDEEDRPEGFVDDELQVNPRMNRSFLNTIASTVASVRGYVTQTPTPVGGQKRHSPPFSRPSVKKSRVGEKPVMVTTETSMTPGRGDLPIPDPIEVDVPDYQTSWTLTSNPTLPVPVQVEDDPEDHMHEFWSLLRNESINSYFKKEKQYIDTLKRGKRLPPFMGMRDEFYEVEKQLWQYVHGINISWDPSDLLPVTERFSWSTLAIANIRRFSRVYAKHFPILNVSIHTIACDIETYCKPVWSLGQALETSFNSNSRGDKDSLWSYVEQPVAPRQIQSVTETARKAFLGHVFAVLCRPYAGTSTAVWKTTTLYDFLNDPKWDYNSRGDTLYAMWASKYYNPKKVMHEWTAQYTKQVPKIFDVALIPFTGKAPTPGRGKGVGNGKASTQLVPRLESFVRCEGFQLKPTSQVELCLIKLALSRDPKDRPAQEKMDKALSEIASSCSLTWLENLCFVENSNGSVMAVDRRYIK